MTEDKMIRVLIVDDHQMVRRGLSMFLRSFDDLMIVGEAASGEEAIEQCEALQPDVVLMDIAMPGIDGIEAIRIIRQRFPNIYVVALTSLSDTETVTETMRAGATSYLMKNVSDDQLAQAIRSTYRQQPVMAPEATQALIQATMHPKKETYHLTEREKIILKLIVDGQNNPEIAYHLSISRASVKYHVRNLLSKLGASNRSEAVALAFKLNILSSKED